MLKRSFSCQSGALTLLETPKSLYPKSMTTTPYRWYILTLAALTHTFSMAMPQMCLPVLFKEISSDLDLSLVQIGMIWGLVALPSIVTSFLVGPIGDRFGTRRTLIVACFFVGLAGALRGLSINFLTLGATVILFGVLSPAIPTNVHKSCGVWFPARQLGFANGVASMGMALGFMATSMLSATFLSPWFGGWRNVIFLYGTISVVMSILWYQSRPEPGSGKLSSSQTDVSSLRQTMSHVLRLRNVRLLGLTLFGISGSVQGTLDYLPLYLREIGWAPAAADGALATFHGVSMACVIPLALGSDKLGSRKKVLMAAALMIVSGQSLLSIAGGSLVWGAVMMAGFVRDGFMAIFMTMVIETEGVGSEYAGTAIGLVMSCAALGNMLAPPLGNSLASISPNLPFLFWAGLALLGLLGLSLTREKS